MLSKRIIWKFLWHLFYAFKFAESFSIRFFIVYLEFLVPDHFNMGCKILYRNCVIDTFDTSFIMLHIHLFKQFYHFLIQMITCCIF